MDHIYKNSKWRFKIVANFVHQCDESITNTKNLWGGAIDNIITWGGVLGSFRLSVTSIFVIVLGDIWIQKGHKCPFQNFKKDINVLFKILNPGHGVSG